jgi:hypothetical protein
MKKKALIMVGIAVVCGSALAQEAFIPFDAGHWNLGNARVSEQAGRQAVSGLAVLRDVEFQDGVIEFDVWAPDVRRTGGRAYPGVIFRMQSPEQAERLYIRPHRAGLYADAIQYTPVFNGVAGWQLYSGDGFTNTLQFPFNMWVSVRVEVAGRRARVFVGASEAPALIVNDLKHGLSKGAVALYGEGAAFFSNFRYEPDTIPAFPPAPPADAVPGVIAEWELSRGFPALLLDTASYPDTGMLAEASWRKVAAEPSGLVDVSRFVAFNGAEPECVLARTVIRPGGREKTMKIDFGYSDTVSVFLNGVLVFAGDSSYRLRDSAFLGIAGYFDSVNLPLSQGPNELLLVVTERFGGWGFMCRDAGAVFKDKLFAVERAALAEIDIPSGRVVTHHALPTPAFPNDVAVDPASGNIFISDSGQNTIYKFDGALKTVNLETKAVTELARFGAGIVDGIAADESGNYLLSINEGRLYRVTPRGEVAKILDTSVVGMNLADFTYIPKTHTAVFPTYTDGRVAAFTIK